MNQHGVPLNRMATISYGKQDPVANNKTKAGRAQNRRVVVKVLA
jgi:outer membrane protein OmpA-like peptidoglycan-associated protein